MFTKEEFLRDERESYLLRHFSQLFTSKELAIARWQDISALAKTYEIQDGEPWHGEQFMLADTKRAFPELEQEITTCGFRRMIRAAVERVVRDEAARIQWNLCPSCGGLCRTPVAKQCFRCGHDWHNTVAKD